jgi:uncharacterized protein Usg
MVWREFVPRKKQPPVDASAARAVGALLRSLRRSAGFKAVHLAAARPDCPAALQTIYAYERGGLVPSLPQFLELVEFYALKAPGRSPEIRYEATAAIVTALSLPIYHVTQANDLMARLRAPAPAKR